jgi:hypothetical protein
MPRVELTRHLYRFFPQLEGRELEVQAETAADVVLALEEMAPGFAFYVCDERGALRAHVNMFIGDGVVADRKALSDRVAPDSRIHILQALSGG